MEVNVSGFFKITEATVLAIHAMMYTARHGDRLVSTREIAEFHSISENHLAKVMQRLVHAGFIKSTRGPKGGFSLAKEPDEVTLTELYELFEGPFSSSTCLIGNPVCDGKSCIFGTLLEDINTMVINYMNKTRLSAVLKNSD